jgi:diguanylate cyclase (GGDEF)-like protein
VARQPRKPRILNPARTSTDRGSVGRLGGDEFVVIAESVPDAPSALAFAVECARAVDHELRFGDVNLGVRASVGVTWTDGDSGGDADDLVARADHAMYRSKQRGTGEPVLDQT